VLLRKIYWEWGFNSCPKAPATLWLTYTYTSKHSKFDILSGGGERGGGEESNGCWFMI
jgi:hypothetical protein